MPDLYRTAIDLPARPTEVYAYVSDPATGPLVSNAKDVSNIEHDNSLIKSFTTRRGTVTYVAQAAPHYLEGVEQRKRFRIRYDIRCEVIGEAKTRVSIDVNFQPQGLRAKLQGPLPRLRVKGQLNDLLEQAQKHFTAGK